MAFRGRQENPIRLSTEGGLNLSVQPTELAPNELATAYNVDYEPTTGKLQTRAGIQIAAVNKLPNPIDFLYTFVRSSTESWLVCVSGGKLYKIDDFGGKLLTSDHEELLDKDGNNILFGDPVQTWQEVGAIESENPTMVSFNGHLVIADGSDSGLLSWDGSTYSRISGSPKGATAVYTQQNRVICNAGGQANLDAVYFSAPENESQWDTTKGAVILRAGYGDGLEVNGFSTISTTLIVSKIARESGIVVKKQFHGVNMAGEPANWSAQNVSNLNGAVNPHALLQVGQDVIYVDSEGFEMLTPTQRYGDISTDPTVGRTVNSAVAAFARLYDDTRMVHIPSKNSILTIFREKGLRSRVWNFSKLSRRFTEIEHFVGISGNYIYTATEFDGVALYGGTSGYLYRDVREGRDEPEQGVFTDVSSVVKFKRNIGSGSLLLNRSFLQINFIASGSYKYEVYGNDIENKKTLATFDFNVGDGGKELHDANEELNVATGELGGRTVDRKSVRNKFRDEAIQAQIRTLNGGRISISEIVQSLVVVGR